MAQKVTVYLTDDLDESEAAETVVFGLDGSTYEIDLNEEHAAQLRDAFAPYVGAARRAGRPAAAKGGGRAPGGAAGSTSTSGKGKSQQSARVQEIRDWGRAHGHQVSERGRLSAAVVQAYEAANP